MAFINIAGYKFSKLTNIPELRQIFRSQCHALALKGTILLSHEGINIVLCGTRTAIDVFYNFLNQQGLPNIEFKESYSTEVSFKRMLVKVKAEIISMGVPEINPADAPAPNLKPETFKAWLDEGKELIILDTRNDYEVRVGKFQHAVHLNIQHFRHFPEVVKNLPPEWKNKTIVTNCTGGIRCEKAAPYLIAQGFQDVYQLEGGILKYLEKCGGAHYEGECFVFDKRVAVDANLVETATVQCFACRQPVTVEQQQSPHYQIDATCPACFHHRKPVNS